MVSLMGLLINALAGLVMLVAANVLGLGVQVSIVTLLICAILGIPGAVVVILLALFDIAFVATVVPAFLP